MRHLLLTLILLLSFTGCQDKKQLNEEAQAKHDAKIAQQARAEVLAELQAEKLKIENRTEDNPNQSQAREHKDAQLNQMGIHMEKDSITIDTNKTKEFFNDLGKKLDVQMKKISADLEKGIIDTKEAGVEINEKHIHIDLNKTQNMLEDWGKKIQGYVQEFDEIANKLENNTSN